MLPVVHPSVVQSMVCKLAAGDPGGAARLVETRRKRRQRGFYTDPSPGFYDLKGKFDDAARANPEKQAEASPELQSKFENYTKLLRDKGVYAGTGHKRILIPKRDVTRDDLQNLGFESVMIAVPEAGQDEFRTYRHPDNLFHLHSHGDNWTMHEDRHPASTMIARKIGPLKAAVQGLPHVVTEGIPGMGYYLAGQLRGRKSTADVVAGELDPETKSLIGVKSAPQLPEKSAEAIDLALGFHGVKTAGEPAAVDPLHDFVEVLRKNNFNFDANGKAKTVLRKKTDGAGSRGSEIEADVPVPFDWY